jgi:hypothetical protein
MQGANCSRCFFNIYPEPVEGLTQSIMLQLYEFAGLIQGISLTSSAGFVSMWRAKGFLFELEESVFEFFAARGGEAADAALTSDYSMAGNN